MGLLPIQRSFQAYYQHVRRMSEFSPDERRQMVSYVHTALNLLERTLPSHLPAPLAAAHPHSLRTLQLLHSHLAGGQPMSADLLHCSLLMALKPFAEPEQQTPPAGKPAPRRLVPKLPNAAAGSGQPNPSDEVGRGASQAAKASAEASSESGGTSGSTRAGGSSSLSS